MADVSKQAEFERQAKDYLDAFNSGDYERVASYWTDDAVSCPPIGEEIRGRAALREFYRKVRPFGPGWKPIQAEARLAPEELAAVDHTNIPLALAGWVAGCAVIWSSLFAIGNFLYGRTALALTLTAVFALSGSVLLYVINTLWDRPAVPRAGAVR